jgi:hypothetical protein
VLAAVGPQVDPVVQQLIALFKEWQASRQAVAQQGEHASVLKELAALAEQKLAQAASGQTPKAS